jgi:hypothetical protein
LFIQNIRGLANVHLRHATRPAGMSILFVIIYKHLIVIQLLVGCFDFSDCGIELSTGSKICATIRKESHAANLRNGFATWLNIYLNSSFFSILKTGLTA